jgi:DNA-directed RNA polymerase subunit omega
MMNQPPLDHLLEKVDSRYTLAVMAARRGRQILEGGKAFVEVESEKPVTVALHEIVNDRVTWERTGSIPR